MEEFTTQEYIDEITGKIHKQANDDHDHTRA